MLRGTLGRHLTVHQRKIEPQHDPSSAKQKIAKLLLIAII
jgi:hypothetical protein